MLRSGLYGCWLNKSLHTYTHTCTRSVSGTHTELTVFQWNDLACFAELTNPPLRPLPSVLVLPEGGQRAACFWCCDLLQPREGRTRQNWLGEGGKIVHPPFHPSFHLSFHLFSATCLGLGYDRSKLSKVAQKSSVILVFGNSSKQKHLNSSSS